MRRTRIWVWARRTRRSWMPRMRSPWVSRCITCRGLHSGCRRPVVIRWPIITVGRVSSFHHLVLLLRVAWRRPRGRIMSRWPLAWGSHAHWGFGTRRMAWRPTTIAVRRMLARIAGWNVVLTPVAWTGITTITIWGSIGAGGSGAGHSHAIMSTRRRLTSGRSPIIRMLSLWRPGWRTPFVIVHHVWRRTHGGLMGVTARRGSLYSPRRRRTCLRRWRRGASGSHFGLLLLWITAAWRPRRHLLLATRGHCRGHGPRGRRPGRRR